MSDRLLSSIQHDWYLTNTGKGEKSYEKFYNESTGNISENNNFKCSWIDSKSRPKLIINSLQSNFAWHVEPALSNFDNMLGIPMNSIHISSDGSLRFQVHEGGHALIFRSMIGEKIPQRKLEGLHKGEIYNAKFFPSGVVAITVGADTKIGIWNILEEKDNCVAILSKAHKQGVFDVDFIERGRNLVSCSRDCSSVLWDVPTNKPIYQLHAESGPINAVSIVKVDKSSSISSPSNIQKSNAAEIMNSDDTYGHESNVESSQNNCNISEDPLDSRDFGTENKVAILACDSVIIWDVRTRNISSKIVDKSIGPIASCVSLGCNKFAYGTESGYIALCDLRKLSTPLFQNQMANCPITSLAQHQESQIIFSNQNGLVQAFDPEHKETIRIFTGTRHPVNSVTCSASGYIYSGGKDGIVRVHKI